MISIKRSTRWFLVFMAAVFGAAALGSCAALRRADERDRAVVEREIEGAE